ncbi:hypothetical protein TCAL_17101 [Tigriopus californicus]|uniref:Uncharacterized protein n=1 Tax=Tigriopus californicus TaxID=6832 RepID=A0A553P2Z7_TIGCA|nr:hypothetical protein TCAL_17101 [Tigriopus californicus]
MGTLMTGWGQFPHFARGRVVYGMTWRSRHGRASIDIEIFASVASIRDLGGHAYAISIQPLDSGSGVVVQSRGLPEAEGLGRHERCPPKCVPKLNHLAKKLEAEIGIGSGLGCNGTFVGSKAGGSVGRWVGG